MQRRASCLRASLRLHKLLVNNSKISFINLTFISLSNKPSHTIQPVVTIIMWIGLKTMFSEFCVIMTWSLMKLFSMFYSHILPKRQLNAVWSGGENNFYPVAMMLTLTVGSVCRKMKCLSAQGSWRTYKCALQQKLFISALNDGFEGGRPPHPHLVLKFLSFLDISYNELFFSH